MLKKGYSPSLSTGVIASSGTLGQIVPPSVVLVLLGNVLNVSVGDLFLAAGSARSSISSHLFALCTNHRKAKSQNQVPTIPKEEIAKFRSQGFTSEILKSFLFPLTLICFVLGSIFAGIASPTEAAGVGAFGAIILAIISNKFNLEMLREVMKKTTMLTSMVFMILIGAMAFSLVFRGLEGDRFLLNLIQSANLDGTTFLILVMVVVFILGFFIDFIEIVFILVPVVSPIFTALGVDLIWIGILLAVNLQTSFLTPPFGFALFYLKGVAPPEVKTSHLYSGIIPFVIIQLLLLTALILFPEMISLF